MFLLYERLPRYETKAYINIYRLLHFFMSIRT